MSGSGPTTTVQNTQNSTQSTKPYEPAQGVINTILANLGTLPGYAETIRAQQALAAAGNAGNEFAPGVGDAARYFLSGGPDRSAPVNAAYSSYLANVNPLGSASLNPFETPGFADAYNTLGSDIENATRQQFAGAGRDLSGDALLAEARGKMQGQGQLIADQYNKNFANRLSANQGLFSAGLGATSTLSGLDQVKAALMAQGINAADAAKQAQIWGPTLLAQSGTLPLNYLGGVNSIALPDAQAFGTTSGQSTGTQTQQTSIPPWMMATGGILGGLSLGSKFAMNPQTGVLSNPFTGKSLFG